MQVLVNFWCSWLDAPLHGIAIDVRGCQGGEGGERGGEALPVICLVIHQFCKAHHL